MGRKREQTTEEEREGKVFPPFIDAYRFVPPKEFQSALLEHANRWGEQAIGASVLITGKPPVDYLDRIVLAIGWLPGQGMFAAVTDAGTLGHLCDRRVEVVDFDWPSEWDVT